TPATRLKDHPCDRTHRSAPTHLEMTMKGMLRNDALEGRVVVITGGGTGLGRSMARYCLELGAEVCITSRKMEVLQNTVKELKEETGKEAFPFACDVRSYI